MKVKLTDDEYKKLVLDIAVSISPQLIKNNIIDDSDLISKYAMFIAEAVKHVLEHPESLVSN